MTEKRFSLSIYFFFFWLWCHFPPTSPKFHSSSHFSGQLALVNCIKFLICSQRENKPERGTGREKVTRPKWLKSLYSIFHCKHRKGESCSIKGYCCCSLAKLCPAICDSWTAACQASQSFTISWSLLKLTSIESVMPSNYLILCHSLLLLPSIFLSIRVFSSELALHIRWPKYWSFNFSIALPINIQDWFPLGWTDLIAMQSKGLSRVFSNTTVQKHQFFGTQLSL